MNKINSLDYKALFIGPNSENSKIFSETLNSLFNDHVYWRKNYFPEDPDVITTEMKNQENFKYTVERMQSVFSEMSKRLRGNATPWHSPRYLGHMNSETLMPGMLGYFGAMLYNLNNVAYESSEPTSIMEKEVGEDFCKLMEYEKGWGHICADGSIANFEAIWYARNLKSLPLAIAEIEPELVKGKTEWELLNMPINETLDIFESSSNQIDILKNHSARSVSSEIQELGVWIVPETKHYSWLKAADVLGVGTKNLVSVKLGNNYRMDINELKNTIDSYIEKNIPVLGVVAVVGTTEEGAVDHVDKIVELKNEYAKSGINFYFHVDAAYGGYARSIFLDENYKFIEKENLQKIYAENDVFSKDINWPSNDVYNAFKAMREADSITIDPHKMGYIPYSAGGIVIKDKRMRDSISYFASYVFEKGVEVPALLGAFIMEGSKAGASAGSVWAAHRVLPLNVTGYGKLIGASVEGAHNLYEYIVNKKFFQVNDKKVYVEPLTAPDFNMVDFIVNVDGNKDLVALNKLNEDLYNMSSIFSKDIYSNGFVTSHTNFTMDDYSDSPIDVLERLNIPKTQWDTVKNVTLLRACILSPFLNDKAVFDEYIVKVEENIIGKLGFLIK